MDTLWDSCSKSGVFSRITKEINYLCNLTARPAETRMGKGKGALEYWVAVVKPGRVMFEISGVPEETAREALRLAMHKLPIKCKIVSRADLEGGAGSED